MSPKVKSVKVPPELEDVATQIGAFIEYWGFKNVHGRIWAHLFLSPSPLDAGELMKRLRISKALASMSLTDLLEYEVIQVAGKSDRGTITYIVNPNVVSVISNVLRKRERRMLGRISAAVRSLKDLPADDPKSAPVDCGRAKTLLALVKAAEGSLDGILQLAQVSFEHWRRFASVQEPGSEPAPAESDMIHFVSNPIGRDE